MQQCLIVETRANEVGSENFNQMGAYLSAPATEKVRLGEMGCAAYHLAIVGVGRDTPGQHRCAALTFFRGLYSSLYFWAFTPSFRVAGIGGGRR